MERETPTLIEMEEPWWAIATRSEWVVLTGWFVLSSLGSAVWLEPPWLGRIVATAVTWPVFVVDKAFVMWLHSVLMAPADGVGLSQVTDVAMERSEHRFWTAVTYSHLALWLLGLLLFMWRCTTSGKAMS